ncbi:MAG: hypothetical protein UZ22_OP11002000669 [Microgenomates bacterium OLB23]|nr:MAG: hypothetical protein UZ22_OP11002000669 [Microgenomates bacterium OLB23]
MTAELDKPQLTWHEEVYGKVPTAEHFRTAEAAFQNFAATHANMRDTMLETGTLEGDNAQEYANRAARLALGMREFCRNTGVDPDIATIDVLIGRDEKYLRAWQRASALVEAEGIEPDVVSIKTKCRELWGKWQLTLDAEEHAVLAEARGLYEMALSEGHTDDEAQELVRDIMRLGGRKTEKQYITQAGAARTLDILDYVSLKPSLESIVASSRKFEGTCDQSMSDSIRQLESEMAEVVELRSFFDVHGGEKIDSPAQMVLKFNTIEDFRTHITQEANGGRISEGEYNRFMQLDSLDALMAYIQEHLAFECIDVVVAAAGVMHRIPANVAAAEADARVDRQRYAAALEYARDALDTYGIAATPRIIRKAIDTAEQGMPALDWEHAIPQAVALLSNEITYAADPALMVSLH